LIETLAEDRRMIMAFDHMEAKAKSRAIRTRQTCLQFLADIENGKADATTKVMKFAIQARWKDAQEHINKIDEALKPHRDALAEAARSVESRERRVILLDKSLIPVQMSLEHEIKAAGLAASKQPAARPEKTEAGPTATPQNEPSKIDVPAPANDTTQAAAPDAKPGKETAPASRAKPEVSPTPTPAVKDEAKKPAGPELDPTPEAEPKASPQPVRIEGLPITKGTIGPAADEPTP